MKSPPVPLVALGALLLAPGASSVRAQEPRKSEIRGVILRAEDGKPIGGVRVTLDGMDLAVETDSKGRFKFPKIAAGKYVVRAVVDTYPPSVTTIDIAQGERLDLEFQVGVKPVPESPAVSLPEVSVSDAIARRTQPTASVRASIAFGCMGERPSGFELAAWPACRHRGESMSFQLFVFYVLAALMLFAAVRVITARNPVHSVLFLVLAFVSCSGLWLLLEAEFLAIVLVLVYVGAVMGCSCS